MQKKVSKYLLHLLILPLFSILVAFTTIEPALAWSDLGYLHNGNMDQGWVNDPNYDTTQNNMPSGWSPNPGAAPGWKRETATYINSCCSAKHSGAYFSGDSAIYQTFAVTPGATYRIFGRDKRWSDRSGPAISWQFGTGAKTDQLLYYSQAPNSQTWYYIQFDVVATDATMTLWLDAWTNSQTGSTDPNDLYFDDMSVIMISPPPPTPTPTPTPPPPTPVPTVLPNPTWTINAIPVDSNGNVVTIVPVRFFYTIWPPSPLVWTEDTATTGTHTRTITIGPGGYSNTAAYVGLESDTGSIINDTEIAYQPYGSPPNSLITYARYWNPPTWDARFDRFLPSGTYDVRYIVPVPQPQVTSLMIGPNTTEGAVGVPTATYGVSGLRADDPMPANSGRNYYNSLNITPHVTGDSTGVNVSLVGMALTQTSVTFGSNKLQDLKNSADANNGAVLIYANKNTTHTAGPVAGTGVGQSGCATYNFCAGNYYAYFNGIWSGPILSGGYTGTIPTTSTNTTDNAIFVNKGATSAPPGDTQFTVRLFSKLASRRWGTYSYLRADVGGIETSTAMTPITP